MVGWTPPIFMQIGKKNWEVLGQSYGIYTYMYCSSVSCIIIVYTMLTLCSVIRYVHTVQYQYTSRLDRIWCLYTYIFATVAIKF